MQKILKQIRASLKKNADAAVKKSMERFFKEGIKSYGVKSAVLSQIARDAHKKIKPAGKAEIFALCETLMQSGYIEERIIADELAEKQAKEYAESDFKALDRWVKNYVSNWAECDTLCNHSVGSFLMKYPSYIKELKKWARSQNRWVKRASAVSLIIPAKRGLFLRDIFEIADMLLLDPDDMVQKGYGWMLKAASRAHEREVFDYVMKHKKDMPRTAFRYAIEKMRPGLKKEAMKK
jgi:3-methyladenine DNA glycosylase AlkD